MSDVFPLLAQVTKSRLDADICWLALHGLDSGQGLHRSLSAVNKDFDRVAECLLVGVLQDDLFVVQVCLDHGSGI